MLRKLVSCFVADNIWPVASRASQRRVLLTLPAAMQQCILNLPQILVLLQTIFVRFLPARRYASAGLCDRDVSVCLSVRLSVRHTPVLCVAERKQDREMYTV